MNVRKHSVRVKIIGKTERQKTFFGIKTGIDYVVAMRIDDPSVIKHPTTERSVEFNQYCDVEVGEFINVMLYTSDNNMYYFSREEAEVYN